MPQEGNTPQICFDRVAPAAYDPVSATLMRVATAHYVRYGLLI